MDTRLWWLGLAVFGVIVTATLFRFYDLQHWPPGLWPDVAANGEDAKDILKGDWRPFYPRGNGREGLLFYLDALSIRYLGVGVWQLAVPTAAIGVLTAIAIYFAMQVFFGRLAGVLAAFFAATSYWHVTISRTGFRATLAPLFMAAFTAFVGYAIVSAKDKKLVSSYVHASLAGAVFAGGFYSYISYRAMVGVVLGVVVLLLLAALHAKIGFPHFRRYGGQMLVGVVAAGVVALPLFLYFVRHPNEFVGRAGQISIFNPDLQRSLGTAEAWETFQYSTRETIKGFFVGEGDLNWRHSVAHYPLLNPLVGLLSLLGILWAMGGTFRVFWRVIHGEEVHMGMVFPYLLLLLLGMLLPVATTAEGIPHGLRALGVFFPLMVLAGSAGAVIIHWVQARLRSEQSRAVVGGVLVGALLLSGLYDGALYFFVARNTAEAYAAYRGDLTEVAEYLREQAARKGGGRDTALPYLVLDEFSVQTVHFLVPDRYTLVSPAASDSLTIAKGELIIFTQSTLGEADRFQARQARVELVESRRNEFGQEIMRVYRGVEDGAAASPAPVRETTFDLDAGV